MICIESCPLRELLLFVDISGRRLLKFNPASRALESCAIEEDIGCVAPSKGGGFVAGLRSGIWLLNEKGEKQRMLAARDHLTEHFHEAPVLIVCCLVGDSGSGVGAGASIYPAVQNMLLAARALGLGATLTTRHLLYEKEVDEILGLPREAHTFAIIPIGYPLGRFGPVSRAPVEQVTFLDRWDVKYL